MASLYERGWRQGTILTATLPYEGIRLGPDRAIVRDQGTHHLWAVVTQNCDLDLADEAVEEDIVELRPIFTNDPPTDRGIRSRRLLLDDARYLIAQSRRVMIAPAALTLLARQPGAVDRSLPPERLTALKTWLGLRYDRPAVPTEYVPLAQALADIVRQRRHRATAARVRDVLIQFAAGDPPRYSLFAVIEPAADRDEVLGWLAGIGRGIPTELGLLDEAEVGTADETPLSLIESSFAADVSQVTWGGASPSGALGRLSHPREAGIGPADRRAGRPDPEG